jgi:hypothetical protein
MKATDIDDLIFGITNGLYEMVDDVVGSLDEQDRSTCGPRIAATIDRKVDDIRAIGAETKERINSYGGFEDDYEAEST